MKVFISWSGPVSRQVALALHEWLRMVIQSVKPYMSEKDIASGARWNENVAAELDASSFGVLCVTPSNSAEPWLQFEAGALSKSVTDKSHVVPLLFRMGPADLPAKNPLSAFQAIRADEDGLRKLVGDINALAGEDKLDPAILEQTFSLVWPKLADRLAAIDGEEQDDDSQPTRSDREMLAEILEILRDQRELIPRMTVMQSHPITLLDDDESRYSVISWPRRGTWATWAWGPTQHNLFESGQQPLQPPSRNDERVDTDGDGG